MGWLAASGSMQSFRETSGSVMSAIYVETSIVGYLTARSASGVVFQARQELTRHWWQQRREGFDL
jgi:hypothetical protein